MWLGSWEVGFHQKHRGEEKEDRTKEKKLSVVKTTTLPHLSLSLGTFKRFLFLLMSLPLLPPSSLWRSPLSTSLGTASRLLITFDHDSI